MPTILLLDRSLSMARRPSPSSKFTYLDLAVSSAHQVLSYLAKNAPAEFVALGLVGSDLEVPFQFTQDLSAMQQYLPSIAPGDAARLCRSLVRACELATREWGPGPACRLVLLTDNGGRGASTAAVAAAAAALADCRASLSAVCLMTSPGSCLAELAQLQQQQHRADTAAGAYFSLSVASPTDCSLKPVTEAVLALCQSRLAPYAARLHCGSAVQSVELHPAPLACERRLPLVPAAAACGRPVDRFEPGRDIRLIGFLQISELYSPAVLSRHLVLPSLLSAAADTPGAEPPHLTVLLQAALRADAYVALATMSPSNDWYCFLHAHPGGRRCALLLSVLEPGQEPATWLGKIPYLAPASDFDEAALANVNPFPVKPKGKRSYASACIVWTKQASVVADVQKVSRWSRKLPDKAAQFYQELNRLRRHALAVGFVELLAAVRDLLQRECDAARATAAAASTAAAAAATAERQAAHLAHAVAMLRPPHWANEIGPPPPPPPPQASSTDAAASAAVSVGDGVIDLTVSKR